MLCHSEGTVTSLITDLLWHLTWLAPLFPYSCSIPLLPHSSWTIFGPHFSRHVSIAFRWRKTKDGPGDGAEGEREREVDVDARWLLSSSLQRALHQVSGLLYGVELLITRGEEEKWCFLFVWVQLSLLASDTAGSPQIERAWNNSAVLSVLEFHFTETYNVVSRLAFWPRSLKADLAGSRQIWKLFIVLNV